MYPTLILQTGELNIMSKPAPRGLLERLKNGGEIVMAEGYVFEFERKGYLSAGAFAPEVVIEHPDLVRSLNEEFVHAGSDVVLAFTYYGHRAKLELVGKQDETEKLNKMALKIAKEVAMETGTLMAGNICNTTVYRPDNQESIERVEAMFKEQITWAVEHGADFILAESFPLFAEASLALECINKYGQGTPSMINIMPQSLSTTADGIPYSEACRKLEANGADVVGVNCCRGPATIMPIVKEIKQACKVPIAVLPVTYRTNESYPTMQSLVDPYTGKRAFPQDLGSQLCGRSEVRGFAEECKRLGVQVIGLCCGNNAGFTREVAEAYGRRPPASKYAQDLTKHVIFGKNTDEFAKTLRQKIAQN